jgi:hypothetical protein
LKKRIVTLAAIWTVVLFQIPTLAWAYIDPATTTYIIQIAAALVITLGVTLSILVYRMKAIVTSVRMNLYRFYVRVIKRQHGGNTLADTSAGRAKLNADLGNLPPEYVYPDNTLPGDPIGSSAKRRLNKLEQKSVGSSKTPTRGSTTDGKSKGGSYREGSWRFLLSDDRKFRTRLAIALLLSGGVTMTVFIFTMLDILATNSTDTAYLLPDIIGTILLFALLVFAVLAGVLLIMKGRLFDIAAALVLALLVATYLQGAFLNPDLGRMTGGNILWDELRWQTFSNLAIWIGIFTAVFVTKYFWRRAYNFLVIALPCLVIAVQIVALFSIAPGLTFTASPEETGARRIDALTDTNLTEVAAEENTIVFVVDMMDNNTVNEILAADPRFFDQLDGFTRFTNYTTHFGWTFPSLTEILTGYGYIDGAIEEFYDAAYSGTTFLPDIREEGYYVRTYTDSLYGTYDQLSPLVDNVETIEIGVASTQAYKYLFLLSLYRNAPLALKPSLWSPMGNMAGHFSYPPGHKVYSSNDVLIMEAFRRGITIGDSPKGFTLIHLLGAHPPLCMNERAEFSSPAETSVLRQSMGSYNVVFEYLKQLKTLGLYDSSTIIIMADHGDSVAGSLFPESGGPIVASLFIKPSGSSGTALKMNNAPLSPENLRATIIEQVGGDYLSYGPTVFEVDEDDSTIARLYYKLTEHDTQYGRYTVLSVVGDAKDARNWTVLEEMLRVDSTRPARYVTFE